ncbi:hypothetical protein SteCoe_8967 [Stentor coeruleus]|uniref:Uncharacterized protein n=1 Tax=Stentor coeruleus TaxID=5963 RepID=A0A1R2CJ31_9CILI|nr:hypothetical protein SteCoe_8967 [Stentor coeruleus]
MSGRRLQLNLPKIETRSPTCLSAERTDQFVESSFSSELSPIRDPSQPKSLNSPKSMPSIEKLREVLAKTSEKLSVYVPKPEPSTSTDNILKLKEIAGLKKQIRKLESEKNELKEINKRLLEDKKNYKEPTLDSDISSIKVLKFSNIFFGKLKENPKWNRMLMNIINSENEFFAQIKSENYKQSLLALLQFLCELSESINAFSPDMSGNSIPFGENSVSERQKAGRSYSSMGDDDYCKLIEESDNLAKTIASQKAKIAKICDKVKESMGRSHINFESPLVTRPSSSLIRCERPYSTSPNLFSRPIVE